MNLYVEKETTGVYGLVDTFINETVTLNTKTIYVQDITAVFKGFTNDFSVQATPNTVKLLGYFGYTEQMIPAKIQKRAKLFLSGELYREGIITLKNTSWINGNPSLFELEFSDGQRNLTETLGEDTISLLDGGEITWTTKNIQKALQSIQTSSDNQTRWFIPLVSVERIISINSSPEQLQTDNIFYSPSKPLDSENILLPNEIRPAVFLSEILNAINKKYDIKIDPTPYINDVTQLTDLCVMCVGANLAVKEVKAKLTKTDWDYNRWRTDRFDVSIVNSIDAFQFEYTGYGGGDHHDASFDMYIFLLSNTSGAYANKNYINSLEVWEVFPTGEKKKKLSYSVVSGGESRENTLRINIGLDIFTPEGANDPSTLIKPLVSVFVAADILSEWKFTNFNFDWFRQDAFKGTINNVQGSSSPTSVNLFESLPTMKVIDFVKSIYTIFGYKKFKDEVLNDFYYVPKTVNDILQISFRQENDLTPYADLSKVTKKTNTQYDGYNLKHFTSEYQQNSAFLAANGIEYGQLKFPLTGKPKSEFKIETVFTAPVFSPVNTNADSNVYTFFPFGKESKLNVSETRFIYDTIVNEFPIFYYNEVSNISTPYAFVDTDSKVLKSIGKYHKISHKSSRIKTGISNYITSLFNIITGDFIDQNTLYVQAYKTYIEDTLSGKKLIHTINLKLPIIEIQKFDNSQEIIIKETKYTVLESDISLEDGKTKLTLLNK